MWDRDLVSRLSSKAAQVLLSLLLTREIETQQTAAEFAKTTGLGQRSIAPALLELKSAGLIDIVPQPGKPSLVRLVHPEEYRYETSVVEVGEDALGDTSRSLLQSPVQEGAKSGVGTATPEALIDQCRMADESKDGGLRVAALQDVWDFAFPFDEYPNQRLSNLKAQRLLVNRSAEWVGQVILDSIQHATSRIQVPLAYVGKALVTEEQHKSESGSGQVISDDLRRLVELGKEQFGAKDQDGPGDKP